MKPPTIPGLSFFVGRETLLQNIEASLKEPACFLVSDSEGIPGAGKTTWLVKLYEMIGRRGDFYPLWAGMADFYPCREGEGKTDARSVLINNFEEYQRFLSALADQLPGESFGDFASSLQALNREVLSELLRRRVNVNVQAKTGEVVIRALSQLKQTNISTGDVIVNVGDEDLRWAIEYAQNASTEEFIKRSSALKEGKRPVLFVDDFCWVADQELGRWVLQDLVPKLSANRRCLVIVAHCHLSEPLPCAPDRISMLPLTNFSPEEVLAYLKKRIGRGAVEPSLAERVFALTGGHPQAVALVADILLERGEDWTKAAPLLENLPADHASKMESLVDGIIEGAHDERIASAIGAGSLVRRFNAELLRLLMSESADAPAAEADPLLIKRLRRFSFTESRRDPEGEEYWKFHEFIRKVMNDRLKRNDPARWQALHACAAGYYAGALTRYEESRRDPTAYQRWFRYEDAGWQAMKLEWLYHLAHADEKSARLGFAKLYFNAFWWWGCYVTFPFCEQLLMEWEQARPSQADQEWIRVLRKFHAAYPLGYRKGGQDERWGAVEQALLSLQQMGGFDAEADELSGDEDKRHLRAMSDLFLAESYRYRRLDDPEADRCYQEALRLFEKGADEWNQSWTLFHLADLAIERLTIDEAEGYCRRSLALADARDYEVMANSYRVMADAAWHAKRIPSAFRRYAVAVFFAFKFHCIPSPDGGSSQPDFYTAAFYEEMMDRSWARLTELWASGRKEEAKASAALLQEAWAPYGRKGSDSDWESLLNQKTPEPLRSLFFPAGPSEKELADSIQRSDYAQRALVIIRKLTPRMSEWLKSEAMASNETERCGK